MTSAPACANSLTAAAPIPREPPVISAALPASEIMIPPRIVTSETQRSKFEKRTARSRSFRTIRRTLNLWRHCSACSGHKFPEQPFRAAIAGHAFGMPLHAGHPVRVAGPLDAFHGPVAGARGNPKALDRLLDRLIM